MTQFDDLISENEARRRAQSQLLGSPSNLPGMPSRGAPPPMQVAGGKIPLPEGFTLAPQDEAPPEKMPLPEGFTLAPQKGSEGPALPPLTQEPAPSLSDMGAAGPEQPQGTVLSRPGAVGRVANMPVEAWKQFEKFSEKAIKSGDLSPEDAMNVAMAATPPGAAYRTGMAVARASRLRDVPAQQQFETGVMSIPRAAAGGETAQGLGRSISGVPIIGSGVRKAAQRSTEELQTAGEAAATRPTGAIPGQDEAGNLVRSALESAVGKKAPPTAFGAVEAPTAAGPSKTFNQMLGKSDEDMIGQLARMSSETKAGANVEALAHVRGAVPAESWPTIQGALIERLGKAPATGEFSPGTWVRQYGNMSEKAKSIVFGPSGSPLRTHLDAIEGVSRRADTWQQLHQGRAALGTAAGAIGLGATAYGIATDPLTTLKTVVGTTLPLGIMARWLSRPATAAPIAQWSRSYERVARSGGTPQAIAAFTLATKNMANSLGIDVKVSDFLAPTGIPALMRGLQNGQPME
jgi:hypothetical protein